MAGRCWRLCSSVPQWMRVGPTRFRAVFPGSTGARAAAYSSSQMTRSMSPTPRPPYSFGHVMPTQPAACMVFCQARRRSKVSRSEATRSSAGSSRHSSGGRGVASQSRNSLRKASGSCAYSKSMAPRPLAYTFRAPRGAKTPAWAFTFPPNAVRLPLMIRVVKTACPLDCFDACGVVAEVDGDRIVRIGGDPEHPFTRGALCRKVNRFLVDRQYNSERITHPLRRGSHGWERIGWDEAFDLAASKLRLARDRHGSLSVLFHRGNGSFAALKCMVNRFFNLFGGATEAVGRYCAGEGDYGTRRAFGDCQIHDPIDLRDHSNLFLIWGRNPAVTNIHMMPVLKEARARGARAIVIDPVRTKSARYVDHAGHPRPGTDGLLALGMAKVLLERRPVDLVRLAAIAERVDAYLGLVRETSLDEVARRTDLPRATIEWLALEYFDRKPATILEGVGLQQYTKGHQTCQLIAALGVLSGNVGIPGGGVNMMNWPWREIRTPELQAEAARTSPPRTLPVSRLGEALASATDPPVTTAFFMQSNLVNQMPDTPAIKVALSRLEFVICLDQFLTDTAETAHLFLPTTTFLEEEDLVPSYRHHWL